MNTNKSLSARIRRRNKQGFLGLGTDHIIAKDGHVITYSGEKARRGKMGNYNDKFQNHKYFDYEISKRQKNRRKSCSSISYTKKYNKNIQRIKNITNKIKAFMKKFLK